MQMVKPLFQNWYCRKTCEAIDLMLGENSFKQITKPNFNSGSKNVKMKFQTDTVNLLDAGDFFSSKDIKLEKNKLLDSIDLLNHFLLSGNASSAMKIYESGFIDNRGNGVGVGYLANILFEQNNLEGVKILLNTLEKGGHSNRSIYILVLKKLLTRVHKHKESRSVAN